MHMWMHGDLTLLGCMDDRLCIIAKVNCVHSGEVSNSFKAIRVSSYKVPAEAEWRKGDHLCCAASFWRCNRSLVTFPMVGLLGGSDVQHLCVSCTAQFSCLTPSSEDDGVPSIAGPDVSATYHWVWTCFGGLWGLGLHSMAVSWVPSWGMALPL